MVEYLSTINAPATELNIVFEILNQSIGKDSLLSIIVVMDQAFHIKATEIICKQKEFLKVPQNGNFSYHLQCLVNCREMVFFHDPIKRNK